MTSQQNFQEQRRLSNRMIERVEKQIALDKIIAQIERDLAALLEAQEKEKEEKLFTKFMTLLHNGMENMQGRLSTLSYVL